LHTLGPDGRLHSASFAPARRVRVEDSTGAGDRLLAALLARMVRAGRAGSARSAGGSTPVERILPAAMREVERALEEGTL
jgi:sugar/nucleoside kinase (ribokinase family)